ncbi:triggering receptor expressed on myeloid cells 1 isoform X2 [Cavia porcellus]|uniref:triggering receptor expressed on myeloid cells 1 isoform X2 n=1 Tax=Cavia porcellus TaxID=10141 RepID=UPI002FE13924
MEEPRVQGWLLQGLLVLLLCVSGLHAEDLGEECRCLVEGRNFTEFYHYNQRYKYHSKAWQRVESQGPPTTLVETETQNDDMNRAQVGRFLLEDSPSTGFITITMMQLQRQDVGLYQCVILHDPPVRLSYRIRLVLCSESSGPQASDPTCQGLATDPALPAATRPTSRSAGLHIFRTTKRLSTTSAVTQPLSKPTTASLDPGVNFTNVTGVIRTGNEFKAFTLSYSLSFKKKKKLFETVSGKYPG